MPISFNDLCLNIRCGYSFTLADPTDLATTQPAEDVSRDESNRMSEPAPRRAWLDLV